MNPTQQQNGSTMEITNHLVNPGETLSQIATRYNTNVAQLRQMNPFITNPSAIKPGWNLSVPMSAQVGSAAQSTAAPAASATPTAKADAPTSTKEVTTLNPPKDFSESCTTTFKPHPKPCSDTYASAIYATDEQQFWLLPERAAASMKEAMHALEKQIAPTKSREERIKGLQDTGLLEYFLEPKLSNFLKGEQRQRMEEIEAQNIEMDPGMARRSKTEANAKSQKAAPKAIPQEETANSRMERLIADVDAQDHINDEVNAFHKLRAEWSALKRVAITEAELQGYTYESGTLFSESAIEARSRVQSYLKARKALFSNKDFTQFPVDEVEKALTAHKQQIENLRSCMLTCSADLVGYVVEYYQNADKLDYHEYTNAIIKASEYGIALPEFALISDDLPSGISQFKLYVETEKKQTEVTSRLQEKYKNWIEATGQNAQAPAGLVDAERAEWDRLQTVKDKLREQAQSNVAAAPVRRHLLWDPEQFQPQPVDRLVNAGFPLREISRSDTKGTPLGWFSLMNLKDAPTIMKEDLDKAKGQPKKVLESLPKNGADGADKNSARGVFRQWLIAQGARCVDDQGDWFDAKGWFEVKRFHDSLKKQGWTVTELEDSATLNDWGDHLKQLVFKKSIRGEVRLFDKSPQAQFVRCLTPPQSKLHGEVKLEGPKFTAAEGFQVSASVALSLDLARGEVELMKIDMPSREKAKDTTLEYYLEGNSQVQNMNFGRFSFHFGVRAWGYAGASLMLAGSVELNPILGNMKYGATLSPVKPAQREDASAKAERKDHEEMKKAKAESGDTSPTPDLEYKSKSGTYTETKTSGQMVGGRAANVQIENGAKASFNIFGGIQAAIELTGALNWAPPKELAALRTAPTTGINNSKDAKSASQWLTLAKLNGSVGAALGAGFQGNAQISLDKGRFILNLKAAVVLGPGASGSFKLEIGYEAVVDILNLYRRELHKTRGKRILWMAPDAADYASTLNLLGAAGLDVQMVYVMGWDIVMNLYEAMTRGGKGGPIADAIVEYDDQSEMESWCINAIPEALGPLLMTLTSRASSFTVTTNNSSSDGSTQGTRTYDRDQAHLLQQKAIELILGWIVKNATQQNTIDQAQSQFEKICMRMNGFGVKAPKSGQDYCVNRLNLDNFMAEAVLGLAKPENNRMRERYKKHVSILGANLDNFCQRTKFHGRNYIPTGLATYTGPSQ